jgi:hypothetical protein
MQRPGRITPHPNIGALADAPLSRRGLLRGTAGVGAAAALWTVAGCRAQGPTAQPQSDVAPYALLSAFPQDRPHIPAGVPTRLPFLVGDAEGVPLVALTGNVAFRVSFNGQTVVEAQEVAPRAEGVDRAYLPLTLTFPEPGIYEVEATYEGAALDAQVQAFPVAEVEAPVVGQPLPPLRTPTTEFTLDVDPLCSRSPSCPFHAVSLDDALGRDLPVVLLVASPAYCQTSVCGPVLDHLMEVTEGRTDLTVLHCEVYRDPKKVADLADAQGSPVTESYDLTFEPVLYVTDPAGIITARADVIVDRSEMAELIG